MSVANPCLQATLTAFGLVLSGFEWVFLNLWHLLRWCYWACRWLFCCCRGKIKPDDLDTAHDHDSQNNQSPSKHELYYQQPERPYQQPEQTQTSIFAIIFSAIVEFFSNLLCCRRDEPATDLESAVSTRDLYRPHDNQIHSTSSRQSVSQQLEESTINSTSQGPGPTVLETQVREQEHEITRVTSREARADSARSTDGEHDAGSSREMSSEHPAEAPHERASSSRSRTQSQETPTHVKTKEEESPVSTEGSSSSATQKDAVDEDPSEIISLSVPPPESKPVTELSRPERIFRDRVDKCSMSDIIDLTKQLNGRIENISLKIPTEYDAATLTPPDDSIPIEKKAPPGINTVQVALLVEQALGQTLYKKIKDQSDRQRGEISQNIVDACQVWTAFCVYTAVKPCLVGFKPRMQDEMQQIYEKMMINDKELTDYWFKLTNESMRLATTAERNLQDPTYMNENPEIIVAEMSKVALGVSDKDLDEAVKRERIYTQMHTRAESQQEYQPISTHWRGFLHEHDRECSFFATHEQFTADVLRYGLYVIFDLAKEVPIYELVSQSELQRLCTEAVQAGIKVADSIKSAFFSANLELTLIKPLAPYDENIMDLDGDEGDFVVGTLHLGLGASTPNGRITEIYHKPTVLLTS